MLEVFGDLEERVTKYKVSFYFLWVWWWWCANKGFRNGSRRWARRYRMAKTGMEMMTTRTTRKRRKKGNRGVVLKK
jgi:hypothetical protein